MPRALMDILEWLMESIRHGYLPMVLLLWVAQRWTLRPKTHVERGIRVANSLLLGYALASCVMAFLLVGWIMILLATPGFSFSMLFHVLRHPEPEHITAVSTFAVYALLPLLLFRVYGLGSLKPGLFIVPAAVIHQVAMDLMHFGRPCFCDYLPRTYALFLLIFAGLFAITYWIVGRASLRTAVSRSGDTAEV